MSTVIWIHTSLHLFVKCCVTIVKRFGGMIKAAHRSAFKNDVYHGIWLLLQRDLATRNKMLKIIKYRCRLTRLNKMPTVCNKNVTLLVPHCDDRVEV